MTKNVLILILFIFVENKPSGTGSECLACSHPKIVVGHSLDDEALIAESDGTPTGIGNDGILAT